MRTALRKSLARGVAIAIGLAATQPSASLAQLPPGARLDTVATGLAVPWALAFAPDGRIFVSERVGRIRVIENGRLRAEPWTTFPVAVPPRGAGLLGIALAPDFATSRAVYVAGGFPRSATDTATENRVYRLIDSAGVGTRRTVLLGGIPSARAHAGSALAFGPDGMLYVTTGDAFVPERSADPRHVSGKVLRLRPDGSVPPDNPITGSATWAYGLRNPQGLAWDPRTRALFATEHGPSNWPWENRRRDHDEVNVIRPGRSYGWPAVAGAGGDPRHVDPIAVWTPAIAPSGAAFYAGAYAPWRESLLVGALRGQHLRRLALERTDGGTGWRVAREEMLLAVDSLGRIRAVAVGPDGAIYITTSDRASATGAPDDRIYRIVLPSSSAAVTRENE